MSLKTAIIKYTFILLIVGLLYFLFFADFDSEDEKVRLNVLSQPSHFLTCNCPDGRRLLHDIMTIDNPSSTCDHYATLRKGHQKVISYSIPSENIKKLLHFIDYNAQFVAKTLPDWVIRIYHNSNPSENVNSELLCSVWCKYPFIDLCQVNNLPAPLFDQSNVSSLLWKFLVLGDPLVDRFLISEVQSFVDDQQENAIAKWMQSNKTWNYIKYHPILPTLPHLLGTLGGINQNYTMFIALRNRLLEGDTLMLDNNKN